MDDLKNNEEKFARVSVLVRVAILIWSGTILTVNYVTIPNFEQDKIDPTFIASVFTGTLATFGVERTKANKEKRHRYKYLVGLLSTYG